MNAAQRWVGLAAIAITFVGCNGDSEGQPSPQHWAQATLGPEGGVVEVSDASSPLFGFKVEVPPGAVEASTTITVSEASGEDFAELPSGFAAFNPPIHLSASEPFTAPVRVSFPIAHAPDPAGHILSALHAASPGETWRIILPRALTENAVTVETTRTGYWRWGVTLLEEAEGETLELSLVELHGQEAWDAIKSEVEEELDLVILPELQDVTNWSNCDKLQALGNFFVDVQGDIATEIRAILIDSCGECDVSPDVFMSELEDYIQARVRNFIVDQLIEACSLNFLLELYIKLEVAIYFEEVVQSLHCDYECLIESPPPGLWGRVATYYISEIALAFVYIGAMYDDCI